MKTPCKILGAGWISASGYGGIKDGGACHFTREALPKPPACASLAKGLRRFGRLDIYSRLGLSAIAIALEDAGLDAWEAKRFWGLVCATETGCHETDERYCESMLPEDGRFSSPNLFAYTLPNCMLGEASIHFGISGPQFIVEDACCDMLSGVRAGCDMLRFGLCDTVIAGICNTAAPSQHITSELPLGAAFLVLQNDSSGTWSYDGSVIHYKEQAVASLESLLNMPNIKRCDS